MASITINPQEWPVRDVLPILLFDRTTRENIIFATDSYEAKGSQYGPKCPITADLLTQDDVCFIQPRVLKAREEQALRTRKKAEVFTPAWICCFMNDYCDEVWFERNNVFFSLEGETSLDATNSMRVTARSMSLLSKSPVILGWITVVPLKKIQNKLVRREGLQP